MAKLALADLKAFTNPQTLAINQTIEVSPVFGKLLPGASLKRGSVGVLRGTLGSGATSLFFSLISTPTKKGSWVALVGLGNLGFASAKSHGVDLSRLVSVACAIPDLPEVASIMLDGFDIVVMRASVDATRARKLAEKARRQKSILLVLSETGSSQWPGSCDFSINVLRSIWHSDTVAPLSRHSLVLKVESEKWGSARTSELTGI